MTTIVMVEAAHGGYHLSQLKRIPPLGDLQERATGLTKDDVSFLEKKADAHA